MAMADTRRARVESALENRLGSVVAVMEAIHRRHNASAIIRSCEAFGVHEVHMVIGRFRPSKGASRGAERWLDVRRHIDIESCVAELKARGFRIYVADLAPDAYTPDTVPVNGPVAIVFGAELVGISDEARALADGAIQVPMRGLTESLNVSAAAACALFRVSERRREFVGGGDLDPTIRAEFLQSWLAREDESLRGMHARVGAPGGTTPQS
jgi:tRNA (guanosine-2'-O-)-methyltransferase